MVLAFPQSTVMFGDKSDTGSMWVLVYNEELGVAFFIIFQW